MRAVTFPSTVYSVIFSFFPAFLIIFLQKNKIIIFIIIIIVVVVIIIIIIIDIVIIIIIIIQNCLPIHICYSVEVFIVSHRKISNEAFQERYISHYPRNSCPCVIN